MPVVCSLVAAVISPSMSLTRRTCETMSVIVRPASPTRRLPVSTFSTLSPISVLISFAAWALRCARVRTSPATTAKPRPCSPARAASTAAFRARMLVWNAMPSMTPMMSSMRRADSEMPCIDPTTCATTSPPLVARLSAGGDLAGLARGVRVLGDRGGEFLHRAGGFLQRAGLRLGAAGQVLLAAAHLGTRRRHAAGAAHHPADRAAQVLGHVVQREHQPR